MEAAIGIVDDQCQAVVAGDAIERAGAGEIGGIIGGAVDPAVLGGGFGVLGGDLVPVGRAAAGGERKE